jgi:hypothetical protein
MATNERKFAKIDQIAMWLDLSCRPMALKEIEAALALALSDGLDDTPPSSSIESLLKAVDTPFCINSSGSVEYRSPGSVGYVPKQEVGSSSCLSQVLPPSVGMGHSLETLFPFPSIPCVMKYF